MSEYRCDRCNEIKEILDKISDLIISGWLDESSFNSLQRLYNKLQWKHYRSRNIK